MSQLVIKFENMAAVALEKGRSRVFLPKAGHTAKVKVGDQEIEFKDYTRVEFLVNGKPISGSIRTEKLMVYATEEKRELALKEQAVVESMSFAEIELGNDGVLIGKEIVSTVPGAREMRFKVDHIRLAEPNELTNRMLFELKVSDADVVSVSVGPKEFVLKSANSTAVLPVVFTVGEASKNRKVEWTGRLEDARMAFAYVNGAEVFQPPVDPVGGGPAILGDPICVAIIFLLFL